MKCNKCGERISVCDNCSMRFDKKGASIYCLVMESGSDALVFEAKKDKSDGKRMHRHYCSSKCVKESGAGMEEASNGESYAK